MIVENLNKIKCIHFNFPELMNESAERSIITLHNKIRELKDEAAALRMKASAMDKSREDLEKQWQALEPFIQVEYESMEVKEIANDSGLFFNFDSQINKKVH